jgi:hypothetical protein
MSSALLSVLLVCIEEYTQTNLATCYVYFDRSACRTLLTEIKQCLQHLKNKSWPPIMPNQRKRCFLFDTVRIWEFSPMWTDFDKCHNLSKRNVKLILKVLSDLEPLRGSSNKKTLYSTRSCVNWTFFGTRGPLKRSFHSRFKMAHACQKRPNLHTNSSNNSILWYKFIRKPLKHARRV